MTRHFDRDGLELHDDDLVRAFGIGDELFQIKQIRFEGVAVIENVLPDGRLGTSSVPCDRLERAINNPVGKPAWWEGDYDPAEDQPIRGTLLPCGCYMRRADTEAVLCREHLIDANRRS
jgi:hypothetical protein